MSENEEGPPKVYISLSCDQCKDHQPFPTMMQLMKHIRKTENHTCCCKLCNISFKNWTYLRNHKRLYHVQREDAGEFPCETCGKSFATTALLNHHWKNVHKVVENLNCNLCGKQCQNMSKLRRHTFKCLTQSPKFLAIHRAYVEQNSLANPTYERLCIQETDIKIEKESSDSEIYSIEKEISDSEMYSYGVAHLVEPQLKSVKREEHNDNDILDGSQVSVDELKQSFGDDWIKLEAEPEQNGGHSNISKAQVKESQSKSPRATKVCPICTAEVKYLLNHIKSQHPGAEPESHSCKECPKVFKTPKKLYLHCYSVHRDLPSQCDICSQVFKNPNALRSHRSFAHEEKSEQTCPICFKQFETKMKLYFHKRNVHRSIDVKCKQLETPSNLPMGFSSQM